MFREANTSDHLHVFHGIIILIVKWRHEHCIHKANNIMKLLTHLRIKLKPIYVYKYYSL